MNRNEPNSISLGDVAQAAQVSVATVSLVLRDMGTISPTTRDRVRIAQDLGYRPNLAASLLARQSQDHVVPAIPVALIGMGGKCPFAFASMPFVKSFSQYATQIGFHVIEPERADYADLSTLLRVLYTRGVRGIIVNHSFDACQMKPQDAARFSFLFYGQSMAERRFHTVHSEIFESTRSLWETMWQRGYRRIGAALCRHQQEILDDLDREYAVLGCQHRHRAQRIPPFTGVHNDYEGIVRWAKEAQPDAILAFNGAIEQPLREAGFRIPEDIALCALHVSEGEKVTGLYQDFKELGRMAAHQIEAMICRNETGFPARPHTLLVTPVFNEGQTLPPRANLGHRTQGGRIPAIPRSGLSP